MTELPTKSLPYAIGTGVPILAVLTIPLKPVLSRFSGSPGGPGGTGDNISATPYNVNEIPIEERNPDEVYFVEGMDKFNNISKVKIIPEKAKCANYAFDVTPAKYITKLITEKGIIEPNKDSINKLK